MCEVLHGSPILGDHEETSGGCPSSGFLGENCRDFHAFAGSSRFAQASLST